MRMEKSQKFDPNVSQWVRYGRTEPLGFWCQDILLLFVSKCTLHTQVILRQSSPEHCLLGLECPGVLIGLVTVPCKWASITFILTVFTDEVGKCKSKEELVSM